MITLRPIFSVTICNKTDENFISEITTFSHYECSNGQPFIKVNSKMKCLEEPEKVRKGIIQYIKRNDFDNLKQLSKVGFPFNFTVNNQPLPEYIVSIGLGLGADESGELATIRPQMFKYLVEHPDIKTDKVQLTVICAKNQHLLFNVELIKYLLSTYTNTLCKDNRYNQVVFEVKNLFKRLVKEGENLVKDYAKSYNQLCHYEKRRQKHTPKFRLTIPS